MTNPNLTPQALTTTKLYTPRASNYDSSWHPLQASAILSSSPPLAGDHVLDLCTGTGLIALACAKAVGPHGSVTAVDATKAMLEVAREKEEEETNGKTDDDKEGKNKKEKNKDQRIRVNWLWGDVTQLDDLLNPSPLQTIPTPKFTLITCISALPLLDNPLSAIRHWSTHLAPHGRMILDAVTERSQLPGLLFEAIATELHIPIPYKRAWIKDASSLEDMVRSAGMVVEKSFVARGFGSAGVWTKEEGGRLFDQWTVEGKAVGEGFRVGDGRVREVGRGLFVERWRGLAGEDGMVRDEEGFYVVVGRKEGGEGEVKNVDE